MSESPALVAPGIWRATHDRFDSNTYLCALDAGTCFVVDPGLQADRVLSALDALSLTPAGVVCTHGHFDHIGSAHEIQARHGVKVFMHSADLAIAKAANFLLMACKVRQKITLPTFDLLEGEESEVSVGSGTLRFLRTPGHSPGSCVIEHGDRVFTGDTLYSRGVGLSQLPGEDKPSLAVSLRRLWPMYGDDVLALPGHGDCAPFGWIRANNAKLKRLVEASTVGDGVAP